MTRDHTGDRTGVLGRLGGRDRGSALVVVVGSMLVLAALATVVMGQVVGSQRQARSDQDWLTALEAAQSGADDYLARLNRNDGYYGSFDCSNAALRGPTTASNTCGWTSTTRVGWAPVVAGADPATTPAFHYSEDHATLAGQGYLTVTATGRSGTRYRTLEVRVVREKSSDYLYYTDFELIDPGIIGAGTAACGVGAGGYTTARYYWDSSWTARSSAGCAEIAFAAADVLNGPVFSNDAMNTIGLGPTFTRAVSTASPDCRTATGDATTWSRCLRKVSGTYARARFSGIQPQYHQPQYLQDTSGTFTTTPGCRYYGSTRVVLQADGTMKVWNRTVNNGGNAPVAIAVPGRPAPTCGTLAQLDAGVVLPVPSDATVYVADAPGVTRRECWAGEIGGEPGSTLPLTDRTSADPASYTANVEITNAAAYCSVGNLYLEGVLSGRLTVAAAGSVVIVGDTVMRTGITGTDMLGIVATQSVQMMHPRMVTYTKDANGVYVAGSSATEVAGWPRQWDDPTRATQVVGLQVTASIQALQHSFFVQGYNVGTRQGTLQVDGSIAQRWRGPVATSASDGSIATGYVKSYVYDPRLSYSAPPYFPSWTSAQWRLRSQGELRTPAGVRS